MNKLFQHRGSVFRHCQAHLEVTLKVVISSAFATEYQARLSPFALSHMGKHEIEYFSAGQHTQLDEIAELWSSCDEVRSLTRVA